MTFSEQLEFSSLDKNDPIHIVGINGVEGTSVASFLLGEGFTNLVGHAMCTKKDFEKEILKSHDLSGIHEKIALLEKVRGWDFNINFGEDYLKEVDSASAVFVTQSWELYPEENKVLFDIRGKLMNMVHLYLELAPCNVIGITGSDGKTTTAHLVTHILRESGRKVWLSGNYRQGTHVLESIRDLDSDGYLVLEISNRHLNFGLKHYPDIAVVTNITQNHLTEYGSFDEYMHVKERILGDDTVAVLNADNPYTLHMGDHCKKRLLFSRLRKRDMGGAIVCSDRIVISNEEVCPVKNVCLPGSHNVENILAAVSVAHEVGLEAKEICSGLKTFCNVPERLEFIMELNGRRIYNDLSATSAESTRRGLQAFENSKVSVILGGFTKGVDYDALARTIKDEQVNVFGVSSEVVDTLISHGVKLNEYSTVKDALFDAYKITPQGGVIMISPGGAFFSSTFLKNGIDPIISSLRSSVSEEDQEK